MCWAKSASWLSVTVDSELFPRRELKIHMRDAIIASENLQSY